MLQHVELQSWPMWRSIGTAEARVRLFPCVGANMLPQIVFGGSAVAAVWAGERLFTGVRSNVFCHVVFPNGRVHTEGTEVHLADDSLPHIARTITIHSHLLAMPGFIKHIRQDNVMLLPTLVTQLQKMAGCSKDIIIWFALFSQTVPSLSCEWFHWFWVQCSNTLITKPDCYGYPCAWD